MQNPNDELFVVKTFSINFYFQYNSKMTSQLMMITVSEKGTTDVLHYK